MHQSHEVLDKFRAFSGRLAVEPSPASTTDQYSVPQPDARVQAQPSPTAPVDLVGMSRQGHYSSTIS